MATCSYKTSAFLIISAFFNILLQIFLQHPLNDNRIGSISPQERGRFERTGSCAKGEALRIDRNAGQ